MNFKRNLKYILKNILAHRDYKRLHEKIEKMNLRIVLFASSATGLVSVIQRMNLIMFTKVSSKKEVKLKPATQNKSRNS